jgi:glucose-6-phosphate 1-dehydrogenase
MMMVKKRESLPPAAPACVMALFGVTGDLAKRFLLPSIFNLASTKTLGDEFRLLGIGRKPWTDTKLRKYVAESLRTFLGKKRDPRTLRWLMERTYYQRANLEQAASFKVIRERIKQIGKGADGGSCLFCLALAPDFTAPISRQLARAGLFKESGNSFRRLVVEKPFGSDLSSARSLNAELLKHLQEDQIYRIDHFAGKDAVQDLAVFRFCNSIVEPLWNRSLIDSVQITVAETVGLEGRAQFYEKSGALRDMVPNHLAELLSLIAMEPPISFNAKHFRDKQVELLESVRRIMPSEVPKYSVRAQYGAGEIGRKKVGPYRKESGVAGGSRTETFVAIRVEIDNWRWSGVPFFLRTGKCLSKALTEIAVTFRPPPSRLLTNALQRHEVANNCVFSLKPTEGIHWTIGTKAPGMETHVTVGDMGYLFSAGPYGDQAKGYERLLYDAMCGNCTLFQSAAFVEAGWRMVQPLLDYWEGARAAHLPVYAAGSSGPKQADELLRKSGHAWRRL